MEGYQKSITGKECITPCNLPNTPIIHPQTLKRQTDKKNPFCAVKVDKPGDPQIEQCEGPEYDFFIGIGKKTYLNCNNFLKFYYNVSSFNDGVEWVTKNSYKSIDTRLRVINCSWKIYGYEGVIITDDLVKFYITVGKQLWIKPLYNSFAKYVDIKNGKGFFSKTATKPNRKKKVETINFLVEKLLNKSFMYKFLEYFAKTYKTFHKKVSGLVNFDNILLDHFVDFVELKLHPNLKQKKK